MITMASRTSVGRRRWMISGVPMITMTRPPSNGTTTADRPQATITPGRTVHDDCKPPVTPPPSSPRPHPRPPDALPPTHNQHGHFLPCHDHHNPRRAIPRRRSKPSPNDVITRSTGVNGRVPTPDQRPSTAQVATQAFPSRPNPILSPEDTMVKRPTAIDQTPRRPSNHTVIYRSRR